MAIRTTDLSRRMARLGSSRAVSDILRLAESPEVISLAGGLPDPSVFPLDRIRESMDRVWRDQGREALNYGPNPGFTKLRDWIAERTGRNETLELKSENILVTSGGVEALNLVAMSLLDEGDTVLVEAPTYMVALHVFRAYGARIEAVPIDDEGLDPDALHAKLSELERAGRKPRLMYVIPSYQNPSGCTWTEARRRKAVAVAETHDVLIVEDHAYAELTYGGPRPASLKSLSPENVVLIHTFSKIFGPGVRLGWAVAEPSFIGQLGLCKLGTDQCANTLAQRLVYEYASQGHIDAQVAVSIQIYRRKRDLMEAAMKKHFPKETAWVLPSGGFFIWVRLPEHVDSEALLRRAIDEQKTAFVAGPPFFHDGSGKNFLRLSFSFVPESMIEEGIARIGRVLA
ncbi:MAG TPA: PLP-dependent aminotransferase family protein [Vicinamibacteria bacterium]|nr:PLP-dependent aminotransferase family protein [Vicinamibacteria bacterium]